MFKRTSQQHARSHEMFKSVKALIICRTSKRNYKKKKQNGLCTPRPPSLVLIIMSFIFGETPKILCGFILLVLVETATNLYTPCYTLTCSKIYPLKLLTASSCTVFLTRRELERIDYQLLPSSFPFPDSAKPQFSPIAPERAWSSVFIDTRGR